MLLFIVLCSIYSSDLECSNACHVFWLLSFCTWRHALDWWLSLRVSLSSWASYPLPAANRRGIRYQHSVEGGTTVINIQWEGGTSVNTIQWRVGHQSIVAGAKPFTTQNVHHNIHIYITQPHSPHIHTYSPRWWNGGCWLASVNVLVEGRFHTLSPLEGLKLYHTYNKTLAVAGVCVCVTGMCALLCVSASSHQNERGYEIINWMPAWVQFQQLWPSWVLSVQSVWPVAPTTCTGLWTGRHPRFHIAIIGFNSDRSAVSWWGSIWFYMCTRQTWWLCYKTTVSVYEFNKTGKKNSELSEN